jgi:hypothetical protein
MNDGEGWLAIALLGIAMLILPWVLIIATREKKNDRNDE